MSNENTASKGVGSTGGSAWLCREASGSEYLLYLGGEEAKPERLDRNGSASSWTWGNGFENVVIFTPKEWAKISPVILNPGDGPVPMMGGFQHLPNHRQSDTAAEAPTNFDNANLDT